MSQGTLIVLWWLCGLLVVVSRARAEAVQRLEPERLKATHESIIALAKQRQPMPSRGPWRDCRTLIHVHSSLSFDSPGKLDEIVAAARQASATAILFTEHPRRGGDCIADGHRGVVDGVLLVPGAEMDGLLVFPAEGQSLLGAKRAATTQQHDGALTFRSHLEDHGPDRLPGLTGTEIYNTHADFKDELRWSQLLSAAWMAPLAGRAIEQYPQEAFGAIQDYPADYLRRWDEWTAAGPLTGIAANDSHHNQVYTLDRTEPGRLRLFDALGKTIFDLPAEKLPFDSTLSEGGNNEKRTIDLDPYVRSFRHVSTHLLVRSIDRRGIWEALAAGRAYVAFDWLADPTGFTFTAHRGSESWPMGSRVDGSELPKLRAAAPLPCQHRLYRDGRELKRQDGREIEFHIDAAGRYRVEAWLAIAGEPRLWILSNPVYVHTSRQDPSM